MQGELLSYCYYSPTASDCTVRTVEPHHMVNYMGNWHLIAYCRLRDDWCDFLLGRMSLTQVEGSVFQIRPGEEWRPHLANTFGIFQNRESFNVVLRFTPERSRWVKGELWHEGQGEVIEDDGSPVPTIPACHDAEIIMEILKHGSQVEVLDPEWLKDKVIDELGNAVNKYQR